MANTILPKITVKDCKADPKKVLASDDPKTRHPLIRVYGIATGTKEKKLTNPNTGEVSVYEQLRGDFRAINPQTGERFQSGVLYLPSGIHELISSPLDAAKAKNEEAEVTFAMDLFSEKRDNPAGYGYGATVLGEPAENDPMKALENQLTKAPALPAPAPTEPPKETAPAAPDAAKK